MKFKGITDFIGFFEAVDHCEGKVYLETDEGDRLNLKSKLTQYVSLAQVFSVNERPEMDLIISEHEDYENLKKFIIK